MPDGNVSVFLIRNVKRGNMAIFKNSITKGANTPAVTEMSGMGKLEVGPPPEYGGTDKTLNPEELFVASINSCIMLVFYYFLEKAKLEVLSYSSEAEGRVDKTKEGLKFTNVEVRAVVKINDKSQSERIMEIAKLADKYCLVSNSVACPVHYTVEVSE